LRSEEANGPNAGAGQIGIARRFAAGGRAVIEFNHRQQLHFIIEHRITGPFHRHPVGRGLTRLSPSDGGDQSRHRDLWKHMAFGKSALQPVKKFQLASRQERLAPIARPQLLIEGKP
jgi:hypothetical protein